MLLTVCGRDYRYCHPSIIKSAVGAGIPALRITGEGISLPGYNTGFIGGCTGAADNRVFVYGNPKASPAGNALAEFCQSMNLDLISLCSGELLDYGGIKFLSR